MPSSNMARSFADESLVEESSVSYDEPVGGQKMKLVSMLKSMPYGEETPGKLPGLLELAPVAVPLPSAAGVDRKPSMVIRRRMVDAGSQTSYDLLEAWFPNLRTRQPRENQEDIANNLNVSESGRHAASAGSARPSWEPAGNGKRQSWLPSGVSRVSPHVAVNYSEPLVVRDNVLGLARPSQARLRQMQEEMMLGAENLHDASLELEDELSLKELQFSPSTSLRSAHRMRLNNYNIASADNGKQQEPTQQSPSLRHRSRGSRDSVLTGHSSGCRMRSSDESLLTGSVVEESASSGGDSSPSSSGVVYKNIIITLGQSSPNILPGDSGASGEQRQSHV